MVAMRAPVVVRVSLGLAFLLLRGTAGAQTDPDGDWEGPFNLSASLTAYPTQELAHAIVLPPSDLESPTSRVLFIFVPHYPNECVSCDTPTNQSYGRTYLWKPDRNSRSTLTAITPPANYPTDGSQDFFCSGHTFLPDGRVLVVGGSDYNRTCLYNCGGDFYGHSGAWLLDTSSLIPAWQANGLVMSRDRWYPTATSIGVDGAVFVFGHQLQPSADQTLYRDEYSPGTYPSLGSFYLAADRRNDLWNADAPDCPTHVDARVAEYPRLHLLSNGLLMDAIRSSNHHADADSSRFLDIASQEAWSCEDHDTDMDTWRWREGDTPYLSHWYGSSVHLIGWHDDDGQFGVQQPEDFAEVVYLTGGALGGIDSADCSAGYGYSSHIGVEKMVSPDIGAAWESLPYVMEWPRVYHNTVILADGSLMAIGGVYAVEAECSPQLTPERFEPPEIFVDSDEEWHAMEAQQQKRGYHSVAFLLPDGTVVSGGGDDSEDPALNSEQSVEIFRPPYCYPESARPEVVNDIYPEIAKDYGEEVTIEVRVTDDETSVRSVALVRPSSVTHGADMAQRYVELAHSGPTAAISERTLSITVQMPLNPFYAPEGHYMLFVVDSADRPSHAVWIQLLDQ